MNSEPSLRYEIIPPGRDDSCFAFVIRDRFTSRKTSAWLTYELFPHNTHQRGLLLTNDSTLLVNAGAEEKVAFGVLSEALNAADHERMVTTKTVVNDLIDGTLKISNAKVLVHRFGPVPAVVLTPIMDLSVHGNALQCQIAVFPRPTPKDTRPLRIRYTPSFVSFKSEFRRCMSVTPHLVFREYFEGVAEDFHDLRRILKHSSFYRRVKDAERRLAESIGSKLDQLLPKIVLANSSDKEEREAWEFFLNNAEVLYEAKIAHDYALFALNQIYRQMGVRSRLGYLTSMGATHQLFETLLGGEEAGRLALRSDVLQFFRKCGDRHEAEDLFHNGLHVAHELWQLAETEAPNGWCREFAKFGAFGAIQRRLVVVKGLVRVFISCHHQIASSHILRDQISALLREIYGNQITPIFIEGLPPGMPFRHIIRAAIWLSQAAIAICPADTADISDVRDKDYKWIAREAEYSLLLGKQLLFTIQDGSLNDRIIQDMTDPQVGYLVSGSRLPSDQERAQALVRHFNDRVRVPFRLTALDRSIAYLDPRLRQELPRFLDDLIARSLEMLLDGYLSQFSLQTQRTLIFLLRRLGPRGSHPRCWLQRELVPLCTKATVRQSKRSLATFCRKRFDNFWAQTHERKVDVGPNGTSLIAYGNGKYIERLCLVIRVLRPNLKRNDQRNWRNRWLSKWEAQLRIPRIST